VNAALVVRSMCETRQVSLYSMLALYMYIYSMLALYMYMNISMGTLAWPLGSL
jgi:hypothetical protein